MSRIGQTYNAKNEKIYPKIVIGSIISDPSVDGLDATNHAFTDEVGKVVSSELAKDDGVSLKKINLAVNGSITNNGESAIISVGQKVEITTNNLESTHIDASSLSIKDANVSNLSVGDVSVGNIIVTNNSYDILKQYRELPEASSEYDGKVVQYIGPTHHEEEYGFVCYSMVKCVMGYDASESLNRIEYMMSDFDSFDSTITHKWLTENDIKCDGSGPDKTYTFDLMWKNNSYLVEVEKQSGERVPLGGESVQSSHLRHMYCPYVWNTDFVPESTDDVLLSYYITFHTSTYVWKPQNAKKLETVSLQSISMSRESLTIYDRPCEYELYVNFNPANATNKKVTWSSSNPSVVSVSNGIIEPHNEGASTITATSDDGGHMASCDVTVNHYIDVSTVEVRPIVMGVGDVVDANEYCTIVPGIDELTEAQITYSIDDVSVATCDSSGTIIGNGVGDTSLTVQVITMLGDEYVTKKSGWNTITVTGKTSEVTDKLTSETTGITNTQYSGWSDKTGTSGSVYAGRSAVGYSSIQLNSSKFAGIITTTSGGKATKVIVEWEGHTTEGRMLDVYGKNSAYKYYDENENKIEAADLYNTDTTVCGTKIGSIVYGESTELSVKDNYKFIGLRPSSNAMYLTSITIIWDKS